MQQGTLTVITSIKPSTLGLLALRAMLEQANATAARLFSGALELHFARFAILDHGPDDDAQSPLYLVFGADFGSGCGRRVVLREFVGQLVDALVERGDRLFDAIYRGCEGYPPAGLGEPEAVKAYLFAHHVKHAARYIAFPYRAETVEGLRRTVKLREQVEARLDELRGEETERIYRELRAEVRGPHRSLFGEPAADRLRTARCAAAQATLLYGAIDPFLKLIDRIRPLFGALKRVFRRTRAAQVAPEPPRPVAMAEAHDRSLGADLTVQNPMTHVATIRGGRVKVALLRLILRLVSLRMRRYLVGLNHITTIHFARWVIFQGADGRHRLLFFSNYDGTWDSYIGSFVDNDDVRKFLVIIWSRTEQFPGAGNLESFKGWLRARQVPTLVWHSAYRELGEQSIVDLQNALQVRRLLAGEGGAAAVRAFFSAGVCPGDPMVIPLSVAAAEVLAGLKRSLVTWLGRRQRSSHGAERESERLQLPSRAESRAAGKRGGSAPQLNPT